MAERPTPSSRLLIKPHGVRQLVGGALGIAGIGAAVLNFFLALGDHDGNVAAVIAEPTVWTVFLAGVAVSLSIWIARLAVVQVIAALLIGYVGTATNDPGDLTGFIFVLLGLLLAYEYRYLDRRPLLITTIITGLYVVVAGVGMTLLHSASPEQMAGAFLAAGALAAVAWGVIFLRAREHHIREAELEQKVAARTVELSRALQEYKLLLAELHHRTKNNLQMIASILSLDDARLPADGGELELTPRQRRIEALARVHDQLYASTGGGMVDLAGFLQTYAEDATMLASRIGFRVHCTAEIRSKVTADLAIRMGLIINEIVMNAIETAERLGHGGDLSVLLKAHDDSVLLATREDGERQPSTSGVSGEVGTELVEAMVDRLGGTAEVADPYGITWEIRIPIDFGRTKWEPIE
jgi:two-component sensor histidine kinase